jgi:hypothetical protein
MTMPKDTTVGLTPLDLESLANLDDGKLAVGYKRQLLIMARDCIDRPKLKKRRKLTMHVFVETLLDEDGEVRGVAIEAEIVPAKIPNYVTYPQKGKLTANGFEFDPDANDAE